MITVLMPVLMHKSFFYFFFVLKLSNSQILIDTILQSINFYQYTAMKTLT